MDLWMFFGSRYVWWSSFTCWISVDGICWYMLSGCAKDEIQVYHCLRMRRIEHIISSFWFDDNPLVWKVPDSLSTDERFFLQLFFICGCKSHTTFNCMTRYQKLQVRFTWSCLIKIVVHYMAGPFCLKFTWSSIIMMIMFCLVLVFIHSCLELWKWKVTPVNACLCSMQLVCKDNVILLIFPTMYRNMASHWSEI